MSAVPPASASDAPTASPGTRTRSGNAMARTRVALLEATARSIERDGVRRTTMVDVAALSGVAKATLYNHFRTKDDLLAALVTATVGELAAAARAQPSLELAFAEVARGLGGSALRAKVAADEPALLVPMLAGGNGRGWHAVRVEVAMVLEAFGRDADHGAVETVLRWAAAQLVWPLVGDEAEVGACLLVRGLGPTGAPEPAVDGLVSAVGPGHVPGPDLDGAVTVGSGLGWPD